MSTINDLRIRGCPWLLYDAAGPPEVSLGKHLSLDFLLPPVLHPSMVPGQGTSLLSMLLPLISLQVSDKFPESQLDMLMSSFH